ncbi:MAG: ABC transporter ATP-binding protein [Smithella sp.]
MNYILSAQNLILRRGGVTVLDVNELNIAEGRILAVIGPNGAGKSTLLLTLAGLLKPDQGRLSYKGLPIITGSDRAHMRHNISVVFQEPLLLNTSVYNNVALGLKFRHLSKNEVEKNVDQALEYFGINILAKRSAKTLSGGEAKRVSLARAFALKPELILMDEAFSSLDPPTREALINDLRQILTETKITAVLALHDREETLRLAEDVVVIDEGKIVHSGTANEIFSKPETEFVADFVGTETILSGIVETSKNGHLVIFINEQKIEAVGKFSVGDKVYCCLRPEIITVSSAVPGITSARNVLDGKVLKIIRLAFFYKLVLDCGFPLTAYVTIPSYEDLCLRENSPVTVSFKATSVHLIKRNK